MNRNCWQLNLRSDELLLRGEFEIGEEVAKEFLAIAKNASDEWHSYALVRLGTFLENTGRYEEAAQHAHAAQSIVAIDDPSWKSAAGLLGNIYLHQEDYSAAREQYLDRLDRVPDSSFALNGLSSIEYDLGNFDNARQYASRAFKAAGDKHDRELMSVAQNMLGAVELKLGNIDVAKRHFLNALEISEEISRRRGISVACDRLSEIECDRNNYKLVLEYGQRAILAETEMGRKEEVAKASSRVAFRLENAALPEVLLAGITLCQTAFTEATEPIDRAWALQQQSRFQTKLKQYDQAEASLKQAMQYIELSDGKTADIYVMLGNVQRKRKHFAAARDSFARALELAEKYHHVNIERLAHVSLAYCAANEGSMFLARHHWQLALKVAERNGDQQEILSIQESLKRYRPNLVSRIRFWLLGR